MRPLGRGPGLDPKRSFYAVRGLSLSCGTSKNGARVAFTARCASTPSCSKPFPQKGQFSNSPRLACLANHSPQCQHFTTAVTHILIFHLLSIDTISIAFRQGRRSLHRLS